MKFKIGDRVQWRTDRQYTGTVGEVNEDTLGVYWDHHSRRELVRNHFSYHVLFFSDAEEGFEVDA